MKKKICGNTAKNIMSATLAVLMIMSSTGTAAVNAVSVSAKTAVKKTSKSTKKTAKKKTTKSKKKTVKKAPTVYITPSKKTVYKKSSFYVYLKNNKGTVKWSSSNTKVTLSKKAKTSVKVYAKTAGTSYVTAKVGKKTYTCKVIVKSKNSGTTHPAVFNPKLSCTKKTLKVNESFTLTISGTNGRHVEWDMSYGRVLLSNESNTSVTVKGVKGGKDSVTAEVSGKVYTCEVSVAAVDDNPIATGSTLISNECLTSINKARAKRGLAGYKTNPLLEEFAKQRMEKAAKYYLKYGEISHDYEGADDLHYNQDREIQQKYPEIYGEDTNAIIKEDIGFVNYSPRAAQEDITDLMVTLFLTDNHKKDLLAHCYTHAAVATKVVNGKQLFLVLITGPHPTAKELDDDSYWG